MVSFLMRIFGSSFSASLAGPLAKRRFQGGRGASVFFLSVVMALPWASEGGEEEPGAGQVAGLHAAYVQGFGRIVRKALQNSEEAPEQEPCRPEGKGEGADEDEPGG